MNDEAEDHCTWVNSLCPSDLCVLPYGHIFSTRGRHITSTTYGSADTSWEDQQNILRDPKKSQWDKDVGYLAPRGTPERKLINLGWAMQRKQDRKHAE